MSDQQDTPLVTLDDAIRWVRNALALVGLAATCAAIGLYHSGFFTWLFNLK